ncbi:hypothetical protein [Nannocystis exedens]|uniref:hypothetical protein n=1 Tax=Nannocystis exedens TaxID=54 RepID=UPI001160D7F6|nr:hypothetical protein [Nannocystis exedens]
MIQANIAEAASVGPRGKVRVGVETEVFSWTRATPYRLPLSMTGSPPSRSHELGFGPGRPVSIDGRPAGGGSLLALGVGYGSHKHLLLGARFGMNLTHSFERNDDPSDDLNDDETTRFLGTLTPYLEILPISEGRVLPYILVRAGLTGATATSRYGDTWTRIGALLPLAGAGVGAHAFITPAISIDFGATFDYRWVYGVGRSGGPGNPGSSSGWSRTGQSFTLAAVLGLSAWF